VTDAFVSSCIEAILASYRYASVTAHQGTGLQQKPSPTTEEKPHQTFDNALVNALYARPQAAPLQCVRQPDAKNQNAAQTVKKGNAYTDKSKRCQNFPKYFTILFSVFMEWIGRRT